MTPLIDTHAHLQDPAITADIDAILARAAEAGVAGIVVCGYDAPSNAAAIGLGARSAIVFPAVGFHPHDAKDVTPASLAELEALASLPAVVAVGEIGLDHYRDHSPRDVQRRALDAQLEIALRVGKPVSVHSRAAEDAIYEPLATYARAWRRQHTAPPGVMHCFGGTLDQARRFVALGFKVSIACSITYPKNDVGRRVAAGLPLDSLVVETDSPYLPPQGFRGKRNEPAYVATAIAAIARVRGLSEADVAEATTANALSLFNISARRMVEVA